MEERYNGFVVASRPHPKNPGTTLWTVMIEDGPQHGKLAPVDIDNVPQGIGVSMDVSFGLVTAGRKHSLVAVNVRLEVRQNEEKEKRDENRN